MEQPERLRQLGSIMNAREVAELFGYSISYVRKLRRDGAMPAAMTGYQRPLIWETSTIVNWGMDTGRLDRDTGESRHLPSPGRNGYPS